jgi:hypothetical protein
VTRRHFLTAAALSLPAIAIALALAEVLDAGWLRIVAVVLIVEAFVAREIWLWWEDRRGWLLIHGTLVGGTLVMAVIAELVAG